MAEGLKNVIEQLEQQKAAIERALAALRDVDAAPAAVVAKRRGRPPGVKSKAPAKRKGGITPEGRKRLSEALKQRWAAKKVGAGKGKKK
jgi:hypothetical protein